MCFSAPADFTAAAAIGVVGVATLAQVREPRALVLAALPLLFAAHQVMEGFVWLGLAGRIGARATAGFVLAFMLYAQALLPMITPVGVGLIEPRGPRRSAIGALALVGAALCVWAAHGLLAAPDTAAVERHCIAFRNPVTNHPWVAFLYAAPACGAPLLSSHPRVRAFGALSLVGMAAVLAVRAYALTSVWCLYAAVLSVLLHRQFSRPGAAGATAAA